MKSRVIDWLKENGLLVASVGGLIAFGALGARVEALESQIPSMVDVIKDVVTMQNDIEWIKNFLNTGTTH